MHRYPFLDLGYTHEMTAARANERIGPHSHATATRDLSARLRCLKLLIDAERDERAEASRAETSGHGLH